MSEQKQNDKAAASASVTKGDAAKKDDGKKDADKKDESKEVDALARSHYACELVVVHPLVLLSVVDHYTRVAKDTNKRVVGVLLGELYKGKADITNSYAVPFEEDPKDPNVWYVDRQYHEDMFAMFKKVNAREKVLGWYSTGPKIRPADIEINEMFRSYTADPILVIVDVNPKGDLEIPTQAYVSVESKPEDSSVSRRAFQHVLSEVGAYEAEEVGVEHLLRNIRDTTESSMSDQVRAKVQSLKALRNRLQDIAQYLSRVQGGKLPVNHQILYNLQDMFNLMPDLQVKEVQQAFTTNTNDNMMTIYISSLIRSICALHDLINNKIVNKAQEVEEGKTEAEKKAERQKKLEEEEEKKRKAKEEEEKKKKAKEEAGKGKKKKADDF